MYAPHSVGVFHTFCVCTNYYVQSNSLHEMALLPKWSIIYTPPWTFLESGARFQVKVSYSEYIDVVMCASCFPEKGVCTSQYRCIVLIFCVCSNSYAQATSLHEMALVPKWSLARF